MNNNWQYIILGIILIIWGVSIIYDPVYYSSKYQLTWDFTEVKWPFGGFISVLGGCFLIYSLKKKN